MRWMLAVCVNRREAYFECRKAYQESTLTVDSSQIRLKGMHLSVFPVTFHTSCYLCLCLCLTLAHSFTQRFCPSSCAVSNLLGFVVSVASIFSLSACDSLFSVTLLLVTPVYICSPLPFSQLTFNSSFFHYIIWSLCPLTLVSLCVTLPFPLLMSHFFLSRDYMHNKVCLFLFL